MSLRFICNWSAASTLAFSLCAGSAAAEEVIIVEFYNTTLKHYVLITDPAEVAAIERGDAGDGWERTGGTLNAYSSHGDAAGLVGVCRFYGNRANGGPNSHFFTADPAECAAVKLDPGWTYEGIAFYVKKGPCSPPDRPVYRAYNNGFRPQQGINDGNHRFSIDHSAIDQLVSEGWRDEGIVFCVAGGTAPGTNSGSCLIPKPGYSATYVNSIRPSASQRSVVTGTADHPIVTTTFELAGVTNTSKTKYDVYYTNIFPGKNAKVDAWGEDNETIGAGFRLATNILYFKALDLPMRPGEVQGGTSNAVGTLTMDIVGQTCSGNLSGKVTSFHTFREIETITVPAGTFRTCRFMYTQFSTFNDVCGQVTGGGKADDRTILWFAPDVGLVRSLDLKTGATLEMTSYAGP